jgi:hypothetical protein
MLNREINTEFRQFRRFRGFFGTNSAFKFSLLRQNSLRNETGILAERNRELE